MRKASVRELSNLPGEQGLELVGHGQAGALDPMIQHLLDGQFQVSQRQGVVCTLL